MPIEEADRVLRAINSISRYLRTPAEIGLGYVRLEQLAPPVQRVKLAGELQKPSNGRTVYVLDEPTTGPHSRTPASCSW